MLAEAANSTTDRSQVIAALQQASRETGSDFHYLLGTAMRESSLKTQAQSSTSSARGLFQFTGQTWLGLIKNSGAKYGLGAYADAISRDADGHFRADNAADRTAILALRNDPKVAALMAGEFTNQSKATLESTLGRGVCEGELYAAHFLGPAAACKLIQLNASRPGTDAAEVFPQAADANRSVFYHADGSAKTVRDVYNWALKQPSVDGAATSDKSTRPASPQSFDFSAGIGQDANALLTQVMSWSPHKPSFSPDDDGDGDTSLPISPFLMTPGVMDILSSVSPSHA